METKTINLSMKGLLMSLLACLLLNTSYGQTFSTGINTPGVGYSIAGEKFEYDQKSMGHYSLGWYRDSWHSEAPTLWLSAAAGMKFFTEGKPRVSVTSSGNVGINTTDPKYMLDVNGSVHGTTFSTSHLNVPSFGFSTTNEKFEYDQKSMGHYSVGWYRDSWHAGAPTLWLSGCAGMKFFTEGRSRIAINSLGNVGIGTDAPTQLLDVHGTIRANEIIVNTLGADFVFADDYRLRPLQEVEQFITENKHLPDIAPADSMAENGVGVSELQTKLLQKIEELTLYVIEQERKIEEQQKENKNQQEQNNSLEQRIRDIELLMK